MGDTLALLEAVYCPPLDPALLSAILSDYDLENEDQLREARGALDQLKESAELEEHAGFDASGTGGRDNEVRHGSSSRPESCPEETNTTVSRETDLTNLSAEWQSLNLNSNSAEVPSGNGDIAEELENLNEDAKIALLEQIMGQQLSRYTVQHTLRKCKGNWHKAMDELLSQVYMHEAENSDGDGKLAVKSIDAFSEENTSRRGRKGKGKKKGAKLNDSRRSSSLPTSPVESEPTVANAWQGAGRDIEFIASRTGEPSKTVATIYYNSGASRAKTIGSILKNHLSEGTIALAEDPIKAVTAHDLGQDFPSIDSQYVASLINLTYPSTAAARELAEALTTRPSIEGGIEIIPTYVRPNIEEADAFTPVAGRNKPASGHAYSSNLSDARERASTYAAARSAALAQAYAAHRKAKSDRLMGGVAGYYGQVSRDYYALSSAASAAAADEIAASQSSASEVDLHGIDVLNAVRIARERVEQWWEGLGENRANGRIGANQRQAGYKIVVGLGRHSEGGRSKLGPAVRKMLTEQGWKNELNGAVITVQGRARK